jgi:hypothetical protein
VRQQVAPASLQLLVGKPDFFQDRRPARVVVEPRERQVGSGPRDAGVVPHSMRLAYAASLRIVSMRFTPQLDQKSDFCVHQPPIDRNQLLAFANCAI